MTDRAIDREYLRYQYADSEKLRIRADSHRLYSERPNDWNEWVLARLDVRAGDRVLDVGCGPGLYHPLLAERGAWIAALDFSAGMTEETRDQARRDRLPVQVLRADAQALPFADWSFDRTMANHVLYYVPDQVAALGELRRVTKPGGRVVMATVAGDQTRRLLRLHEEVAAELGLRPTDSSAARFTLDHLELVRRVFPQARVEVRRDAFVFPEAEPALRYYASGMVNAIEGPSVDHTHRDQLIAGVRRRIEAIVEREGVFRAPKDAGVFVAEV